MSRTHTPSKIRLETVPCPLCGHTEDKIVFQSQDSEGTASGTFQLVQCCACRFKFLNPRPVLEDLQKCYASNYHRDIRPANQDTYKRLGRPLSRYLLANFYRYPIPVRFPLPQLLRAFLTPLYFRLGLASRGKKQRLVPFRGTGRLLDVGCGSGAFADLLSRCGWKVQGIDRNERAIEIARRRGLRADCTTLEEAEFPDRSFDVIHLWHVLEHLTDPVATLKEIHRILDDDGLLVLGLPMIDSVGGRLFGPRWSYLEIPRHLSQFTRSSITETLRKAGFSVQKKIEDPRNSDLKLSLASAPPEQYPLLRWACRNRVVRRLFGYGIALRHRSSAVVLHAIKSPRPSPGPESRIPSSPSFRDGP